MNRAEEILNQLDKCNSDYVFPMLDNGYIYPSGTKLTAYRDEQRWVIVIEVVGFNYRGGGHNGIYNCLHVFGNCLSYEPGTNSENFLNLTDDANNLSTFDEEEYFYLNPDWTHFTLRNNLDASVSLMFCTNGEGRQMISADGFPVIRGSSDWLFSLPRI